MIEELEPVLNLLKGHYGWVSQALVWIGALRLVAKFFSTRLQNSLTRMVANKTEPELLVSLLTSKVYRVTAFAVDLLLSIKLPSSKDLNL